MLMHLGAIWLLLIITTQKPQAKAEIFTAMVDVQSLLNSGKEMARIIDDYIAMDQSRLEQLKKLSDQYKSETYTVQTDNEGVISHPVEGYLLVKNISEKWSAAENLMKYNPISDIDSDSVEFTKLPTEEDTKGMIVGLLRIQDVYKLSPFDLAEGRIKGIRNGDKLTAAECLKIATVAYERKDYYHTLMWAQEALTRVKGEQNRTIDEQEALEYLAFAMYKQGNVEWALHHTLQLKQMNPNHPRVVGNIRFYRDALNLEDHAQNPDVNLLMEPKNERAPDLGIPERDVYEALCRGEMHVKQEELKNLHCFYKRNRPFLKLAPIKVEVVHWKPKIVYFRQVISNEEIERLKNLTTPILKRATVHNAATGQLETAPYRISKSAWLKDVDDEVVQRISNRIDMMTDLSMENAEQLQIANYGIGGHYDPHFDMSTRGEKDPYKDNTGNRIATVLFYLSQPSAGGGTVFTTHKITVTASKHDAAFWFNVLHNGEPDMSTTHAACPVMAGIKWVANKWIHERGQEFRRPCALKVDDYYDE